MGFTTGIHVQARAEGLHHWPDAPAPEDYLAAPHRHEFVVHLNIGVRHDDREIEINQCSRWLQEFIPSLAQTPPAGGGPADYGAQSCEQLAKGIISAVCDRYGADRAVTCMVLEDGLQGATVNWIPDPTSHQDRVTMSTEPELIRA